MVKGTITDLKFNLMKEQLKKMFGKDLSLILKNVPLKQRIPSMLNVLVKTIMRKYESDFSDDEEWKQQERYLQVVHYDI